MYFSENRDFTNDSPLHYLEFIIANNIVDSFPESCSLFRLFLTLPIGSASAERVMSSLKIVKEYRRASLTHSTIFVFSSSKDQLQTLSIWIRRWRFSLNEKRDGDLK